MLIYIYIYIYNYIRQSYIQTALPSHNSMWQTVLQGKGCRGTTDMRVVHTAKSMRHSSVATVDPGQVGNPRLHKLQCMFLLQTCRQAGFAHGLAGPKSICIVVSYNHGTGRYTGIPVNCLLSSNWGTYLQWSYRASSCDWQN